MKFRMDLSKWTGGNSDLTDDKVYELFNDNGTWLFLDDVEDERRFDLFVGTPKLYDVKEESDGLAERLRNHFKGTAFEEVIERIIKDEI